MAFKKGESGNPTGRPKGSKNLKRLVDESTEKEAKRQLQDAVKNGEQWAVMAVLDRIQPKLKAITPDDSLDGEYLAAKVKELTEIEERIKALEEHVNG